MRTVLLLCVLAVSATIPAEGQAIRFDSSSTTTSASCVSGRQCPLLVLPGTQVNFCQGTPSTLSACLGSPATTYTSATAGVACATTSQLTPAIGGACLSTADSQGGYGAWLLPGSYGYYLRVPATAGGGTYGPYPVSIHGDSGGYTLDSLYTTLSAACTAAGTGTLAITKAWNATPTQTLACQVLFLGNGIVQPSSTAVVTFSKAINAIQSQKIFDYSLGGTVSLAGPSTVAYPQWWGATGNGVTDDTNSIQYSFNAASGVGSKVFVPTGSYLVGTINMKRSVPMECASNEGSVFKPNANGVTVISFAGVALSGVSGCGFDGTGKTGTVGIATTNAGSDVSSNLRFRDIQMLHMGTCMTTNNTYFSEIDNSRCVFPITEGWNFGINTNSFKADGLGALGDSVIRPCLQVRQIFGFMLTGASTFEGACYAIVYGNNGLTVENSYWENTSGTQLDQYFVLGIGDPYTSSGLTFKGNHFSGGAKYAFQIGQSNGLDITGNDIGTDTAAYILTNNGLNAHRAMNLGNNTYNIGGAGYDPTKILVYNVVPTNSLNSNTNQEVINPFLFTAPNLFTEPQDVTISNSQGALYWDKFALWVKYKDSGGTVYKAQLNPISGVQPIGMPGTGGTLTVNTPSLSSSFPSGLNVDGTYNGGTKKSVIRLTGSGVASGGGYSSDMALATCQGATCADQVTINNGGNVTFTVVPVYANNAAALGGGLTAGMIYRLTGTDTMGVVH